MKKLLTFITSLAMILGLAACGSSQAKEVPSNPGNEYRVIVKDTAGKPVKDVIVQLCSDSLCTQGVTDGDGIAEFKNSEEGRYTVHVVEVPDGFAEDTREYEVPLAYGDITITLQAGGSE